MNVKGWKDEWKDEWINEWMNIQGRAPGLIPGEEFTTVAVKMLKVKGYIIRRV